MSKSFLVSEKQSQYEIASQYTAGQSLQDLLDKEYLLTNKRGGYCSSTIICCNTRRYHGLLVATLNPPANRVMALSNLFEKIIFNGKTYDLSTFEFNGDFHPSGHKYLKRFYRDIGVHFDYEIGSIELTKSVYLARDTDLVLIEYDFKNIDPDLSGFEFTLRPFSALRDFHSLQKSYTPFQLDEFEDCFLISNDSYLDCDLLINCSQAVFEQDPQWWYNFTYQRDYQRCQDYLEDLWTPGFYKCRINEPTKIVLKAQAGQNCMPVQLNTFTVENVTSHLENVYGKIVKVTNADNEIKKKLILAADQFICNRGENSRDSTTILAGFPWFFDWGRDAFISLSGLLLSTKRYEEAKSVLTTFAAACDEGMIPNRFDDRSDTVHFNSIDASMWFINAAFEYLKISGDEETFITKLLPAIEKIINSYKKGTLFDIHADSDGLIMGGDIDTQLTWMDAKCDGVAFTPRFGKAVEVNSLWYNALCKLSQHYNVISTEMSKANEVEKSIYYNELSKKVADSFSKVFWNDKTGYLNDCVRPDGVVDTSCRCNQIFAVSLQFSPLSTEQQKQIVSVVQEKLLTPYGLRTLDAGDFRYRSSYTGDQFSRDSSYHQGTIWPYMIGPFIEAYLKVNSFSSQSRSKAKEFLEPLIKHLTENACLGNISEIFDGDAPHKHRGCIAQAWSIAEVLRVFELISTF